jgi:V8-like Glu-specific endopeptidase
VAVGGCGGMLISPEYVLTAGTHTHTSYCLELHDILSSPYVFCSSIYFF